MIKKSQAKKALARLAKKVAEFLFMILFYMAFWWLLLGYGLQVATTIN